MKCYCVSAVMFTTPLSIIRWAQFLAPFYFLHSCLPFSLESFNFEGRTIGLQVSSDSQDRPGFSRVTVLYEQGLSIPYTNYSYQFENFTVKLAKIHVRKSGERWRKVEKLNPYGIVNCLKTAGRSTWHSDIVKLYFD